MAKIKVQNTEITVEFLGTWEMIHNPDFKVVEFEHFRKEELLWQKL